MASRCRPVLVFTPCGPNRIAPAEPTTADPSALAALGVIKPMTHEVARCSRCVALPRSSTQAPPRSQARGPRPQPLPPPFKTPPPMPPPHPTTPGPHRHVGQRRGGRRAGNNGSTPSSASPSAGEGEHDRPVAAHGRQVLLQLGNQQAAALQLRPRLAQLRLRVGQLLLALRHVPPQGGHLARQLAGALLRPGPARQHKADAHTHRGSCRTGLCGGGRATRQTGSPPFSYSSWRCCPRPRHRCGHICSSSPYSNPPPTRHHVREPR